MVVNFHGLLTEIKQSLLNRIYGSVPSKIFEYSKLGLPIIYFGGGEGENIIKKYNLGWIAKAGDYNSLNMMISAIDPSEINSETREKIKEIAFNSFDLNKQIDMLIDKI